MTTLRASLCFSLASFALLAAHGQGTGNDLDQAAVSFVSQIRPILSDKCFACHGPDEKTREADLRLDVRDDAVDFGAIEPGYPDQSELVRRITLAVDDEERMPPRDFHKELTRGQIELIRTWIAQGAEYQQHWSYQPLVRPPLPEVDHPRNRSPIDALILASLAKHDLELSPPADRTTLIRRLYFDLLGVPPTYREVRQFVGDDSPDALGRLVDRLLRDRRFGERMAVYWLDLVRYADTIGYHSDNAMEVSAYRDYVINAFNDNMPFDQFTIEQLAGDLLPEPTDQQRIASGYNRLLQTTEEGGAQAKEYLAIYAADRVRNLSGVWMGQTVGCAQCHDHKYDPFTMKDFYSLAAFFADLKENAVGKRQPNMTLASPQDQAKIDALTAEIGQLQTERLLANDQQLADRLDQSRKQWERQVHDAIRTETSAWTQPELARVEASGGVVLKRQSDGSWLSTGENPDTGTYSFEIQTDGPVRSIRLEVFPDASFPKKDGFSRGNGNIVLTGFHVTGDGKPVKVAAAEADYQQKSWPVAHAIDANKTSGWAIDGHHKPAPRRTAIFRLATPTGDDESPGAVRIEMRHQSTHSKHLIGRFRISISDKDFAGFGDDVSLPEPVLAALRVPPGDRTEEQSKTISAHYLASAPLLQKFRQRRAAAEKELSDVKASLQTMLVSEAMAQPRTMRVLPRGNWLDDSGEIVEPSLPEFLPHDVIQGRRANRLDLAKWLVCDDNPLTARTFANRLWKLFHGRGLSRNLDDLGGQGEAPTHPELLDWLSVEFRDSGWDVKHLVRLLVTSSTYTQSSKASADSLAKDPENRFYSRQGRWRVEAEFVRDTALSISGLLADDVIGGRSVKPYQPAGYWQHLNFPKRSWKADSGQRLYRRSLYTFWCRTFLHPSMLAFDAPSREECTAQRSRSNIPQQALVLLNDPIFLEASRVLAERIVRCGGDISDRITWAVRESMSRDPRPAELELLQSLYEDQRSRYAESPGDARSLIGVGATPVPSDLDAIELAAWTQVARAIINAYETTSRS